LFFPAASPPGGGRRGMKYGISSKIQEIWQPYVRTAPGLGARPNELTFKTLAQVGYKE